MANVNGGKLCAYLPAQGGFSNPGRASYEEYLRTNHKSTDNFTRADSAIRFIIKRHGVHDCLYEPSDDQLSIILHLASTMVHEQAQHRLLRGPPVTKDRRPF